MELFFDTETTGLPLFKEKYDHEGQPDVVQLAAILSDADKIYAQLSCVINPSECNDSWKVEEGAARVHGITPELINQVGLTASNTFGLFMDMVSKADTIVCHNTDFDKKLLLTALHRLDAEKAIEQVHNGEYYCTMKKATPLCKLPGKFGYKWPKLEELYRFLFNESFEGAHDALEDVRATRRCYYELIRLGL